MFQQGVTLKELLENPDLLNPPKYTDQVPNPEKKLKDGNGGMFAGQSAFLGPNIWDKTVPYAEDFNLEYMDLDEFLLENCVTDDVNVNSSRKASPPHPTSPQISPPQMSPPQMSPPQMSPPRLSLSPAMHQQQNRSPLPQLSPVLAPVLSPPAKPESPAMPAAPAAPELSRYLATSPLQQQQQPLSPQPSSSSTSTDNAARPARNFSLNHQDVALASIPGQEEFDPRKRAFSEEELRPQPMIKKSRKVYVPEDLKDDKYWSRRKKNNTAAKRSRDARRVKENQIALRAAFLEQQAADLRDELSIAKDENRKLRQRLEKYEGKG